MTSRKLSKAVCERLQQIETLKKNDQAIDLLAHMVRTDHHRLVRAKAAEALGTCCDSSVIAPLTLALKDKDWYVRVMSIEALALHKEFEDIELIIAALRDRREPVRRTAATALGEIGGTQAVVPLIGALRDRQAVTCGAVARALGKLGDHRAVEPLLRVLKRKAFRNGFYSNVHSDVIYALADLGVVDPVVAGLTHESSTVRANAAIALGKLKEERAVEPLLYALHEAERDNDYYVKKAASEALEQIKAVT